MTALNIGTLNVQGCREEHDQQNIFEDASKYNLQVLAITETHTTEEGSRKVTVESEGKRKTYNVYHSGIQSDNVYAGVGFVIDDSLKPDFCRISDRIAKASLKLKERQVTFIAATTTTDPGGILQ